jgi:hypothetical protein
MSKSGTTYYRCYEEQEGCKVRLNYNAANDGFIEKITNAHNHEPNVAKMAAIMEERRTVEDSIFMSSTQEVSIL